MRSQLLGALRDNNSRAGGSRRPVFQSREAGDVFEYVLAVLWINVVKPILRAPGFLDHSEERRELPRVTWCTTGALTFLPLHAAGCYSNLHERAYDYIISSYTPTLGALLNSPPSLTKPTAILAVGQTAQSSHAPIPETAIELDRIQELAASAVSFIRLAEEHVTPEAVLAVMQDCSWVHLACHASQNLSDPTASAFHLHGGELSLAAIARRPLPNAELAFLSACETAAGDESIPDEVVHLAAGMLTSGYRTVIATMWSIKDADAPIVAEQFYSQLLEGGIPNSGRAARALHDA
ncbi:hypothetical protein FRC07_012464, partial [Ceratobasidium sp. 392]